LSSLIQNPIRGLYALSEVRLAISPRCSGRCYKTGI
jgi:hypothetical protein